MQKAPHIVPAGPPWGAARPRHNLERTYPDAAADALGASTKRPAWSATKQLTDTRLPALLRGLAAKYPPAPGSQSAGLARWEVAGVVLRLHARHHLPSIVVQQD
jgi:hypothetical protein